ncbi:MAG TPA: acyl carrier protein [Glycomyces sp.]|nr:acyl carrier protein [Glycomyces sp.]
MNETQFKTALAEFTTKSADELAMTDDLAALGVDSVGVFEFVMKVEDATGRQGIEIDESIASVHDLYECVLEAAE